MTQTQVRTSRDDIKEQITYCVLNAISGETDPSDEKLREIISDVISENTFIKTSGCDRTSDGRSFDHGDHGKRSLQDLF